MSVVAAKGFVASGVACGIKAGGALDLALVAAQAGPVVAAATFTTNLAAAAPVQLSRANLVASGNRIGAVILNSGCANAATGVQGLAAAQATTEAVAAALGLEPAGVLACSTGLIGPQLPLERLLAGLPSLVGTLGSTPADAERAATAIMTTDTKQKQVVIEAEGFVVGGMAKGAGMIAPNMATMLGYVFTDASLPAPVLQSLLAETTEISFNSMTVDGDTSTSDTVLLCATQQARHAPVARAADPALAGFRTALRTVMIDLAKQIARDGEGAQKFITIDVVGAENDRAARQIGLTIGNSPLVKTALAAGDANWGRIVMAVGKSGEKADRDRLGIAVGGIQIAAEGGPVPGYREGPVAEHMKGREIHIAVDIGIGSGKATVWTCDLTHGYVDINGAYRS